MELEEFWGFVETARSRAGRAEGTEPTPAAVATALIDALADEPVERIIEFDVVLGEQRARVHQWGVCAAAYLIQDYISDDAFGDFKAGCVALGEVAFEQVCQDPDTLADHPLVLSVARGEGNRFVLASEEMGFVASSAYERRTGDAEAFWDAQSDAEASSDPRTSAPRWNGRFGSDADGEAIPVRLPRLWSLFAPGRATPD